MLTEINASDFLAEFIDETNEHLNNIKKILDSGEEAVFEKNNINLIFRNFHSIKGLAGFVGMNSIQTIVHRIEELIERIRDGKCKACPNRGKMPGYIEDTIKSIFDICANTELNKNDRFIQEILTEINDALENCDNRGKNEKLDKKIIEPVEIPEKAKETKLFDEKREAKTAIPAALPEKKTDEKHEQNVKVSDETTAEAGAVKTGENNAGIKNEVKQNKHLTFAIGKEEYGMPVKIVREILGMIHITPVPKMPNYIRGVINLRGKILPVMDLGVKFGMGEKEYGERTCIIITEIKAENGVRQIGVIADKVFDVLNISAGEVEEIPEGTIEENYEYITGMGKINDRVIILLNIEGIFDRDETKIAEGMKGGH